MVIGKPVTPAPLYLNGSTVAYVSEFKYLGIHVLAGKSFSASATKPLSAFRCSANTILNVLNKPSQAVLLKLLYSNCVPIVTYASEIRTHNASEMIDMDVALNDCIRKIFTYNRWESTRSLRRSYGYSSITEIFAERSASFLSNLRDTGNSLLTHLHTVQT